MQARIPAILLSLISLAYMPVGAREHPGSTPSPEPTFDSVAALNKERRCPEALESAKRLRATLESAGQGESLDGARALDLVVEASWKCRASSPGTQGLAEKAVSIKKRLLAFDDPDVAASLQQLANLLNDRQEFASALPVYKEVLSVRERSFGPDSLEIVPTLNNLAGVTRRLGDLGAARVLYERALGIRRKRLPPADPDLAVSLQGLGLLLLDMGEYRESEGLLRQALAIREKALSPSDPVTTKTIMNIGVVLQKRGDLTGAAGFHERTLRLMDADPGRDPAVTASVRGNLAALYAERGDYRRALEIQEGNVQVFRETALVHPIDLARALNNMGYFMLLAGDTSGAEKPLREALELRRRHLPSEHADIAETLMNIGDLAWKNGKLAEARKSYDEALSIQRKSLGAAHPDTANTLNNEAVLMEADDDLAGALELYSEAMEILKSALGEEHPLEVRTRVNRAGVLIKLGRREEGERELRAALSILESTLGPSHPETARALVALAEARLKGGAPTEAISLSLRAEAITRSLLISTEQALSDRQALALSRARVSGHSVALTASLMGTHTPEAIRQVWDSVTRSRGLVLEEMTTRHRVTADSADPEIARLRTVLASARERLASLARRGAGNQPSESYRRLFEAARDEKEKIERSLAERSASYREEVEDRDLGFDAIQKVLPQSSALVSYVRFDRAPEGTPTYAALLARSRNMEPEAHLLGEASKIDALVAQWRRAISTEPPPVSEAGKVAEREYLDLATKLRRALWDPLAAHLEGVERVFIVPEGAVSLVNLNTLPLRRGAYLVEGGPAIQYLSAERDLVRYRASPPSGKGLFMMSAPRFDAQPDEIKAADLKARTTVTEPGGSASSTTSAFRGAQSACEGYASLRFEPLPGSENEARDIARRWVESAGNSKVEPVIALSGAAASEGEFKRSAGGKRILHLATHGFVIGDSCSHDDPLLLSGLALAGANRRADIDPNAGFDDGILTAEEVASLDLRGVEWAVLSACDTGLGELRTGEGVLGLRRSFQVAGARTLVMSLWRVKDDASREWMDGLYEARLSGRSTSDSVREASLSILKTARKEGRSTHPFFWGAFVAAGDWR